MRKPLALIAIAASSLVCGTAAAIPVEYNGGLFDFNVTGTAGTNRYYITYTADFRNWVDNGQTNIAGLQFSVGGNSVVSASMTSGPGGPWSVFGNQNLSAGGCGGGAVGGVCAHDPSTPWLPTGGDPTYSWVFLVEYTNALPSNFNAINSDNPIRMWFVDSRGRNRGLMSCVTGNADGQCGTAVSEPGTLALLGLGLLGIGAARRRRA